MAVEFVAGAASADQFPRAQLPEIAFVGRSNVGKSSLLNTLLLRGGKRRAGSEAIVRKQLARTSQTPGRTRSLNFYRVDGSFYFVDLPGYGYAKVAERLRRGWEKLAEQYLRERETLRLVVMIIDLRHGATALDQQMKEWLQAHQRRFLVAASKADKLKTSEKIKALRAVENDFFPAVAFSAKTGEGVPALWDGIRYALEQ